MKNVIVKMTANKNSTPVEMLVRADAIIFISCEGGSKIRMVFNGGYEFVNNYDSPKLAQAALRNLGELMEKREA